MSPASKENFQSVLKTNFAKFEASKTVSFPKKTSIWTPKNSMAWMDLRRARIITAEKLRQVNLPNSVCKMFANDARNRRWDAPPLMSLNVPPPGFHPKLEASPIPGEKQILDILIRINTVFKAIAKIINVSLCASVERRKSDNSMCLFTHLVGFPWALLGGIVVIDEENIGKPLPPGIIYEAWRTQFFQSLQSFIPPPIFSKMKRCVDHGVNMEWCIEVVSSDDFRDILQRIQFAKANPIYSQLWSTRPMDFDPRNQDFQNAKSLLIRQVEAEVKSFWTYDRIGVYLKMYFNSDNH